MNPRPEKYTKSIYRFIGARWLSGFGSSTESVESVSRLGVPFVVRAQQKVSPDCNRTHVPLGAVQFGFRDYAAKAYSLLSFSAVIVFTESGDRYSTCNSGHKQSGRIRNIPKSFASVSEKKNKFKFIAYGN